MVDLNEILFFTKVVETKSFTTAANALGVPKSTVSRKISQLEERLGTRLVQRTTRTLSLTDVGQAYYEACRQVMLDLALADRVIDEMQSMPRGVLRVTATVDFAEVCVGRLIAEFAQKHPDLRVELDATDRVVDLVDEGVDVAVRFGALAPSTLTAKKLCSAGMFLCATPAYLKKHGTPTKIADLAEHHRILFAPIPRLQSWTLSSGKESYEFGRPARVVSNSFATIRQALLADLGIGLSSEITLADDLAAGRLVRVLPKWSGRAVDCFAVFPSRRNMAPKLAAFLDFLTKEFSAPPWQLR